MPLTLEQLPAAFESFLEDWEKTKSQLLNQEVDNKTDNLSPLTLDEASDFLKCSKNQMYSLVRNHQGLGKKRGKRWYFFKNDLIKFVSDGSVEPDFKSFRNADGFIRKRVRKKRVVSSP